jgi:hypothetical protein
MSVQTAAGQQLGKIIWKNGSCALSCARRSAQLWHLALLLFCHPIENVLRLITKRCQNMIDHQNYPDSKKGGQWCASLKEHLDPGARIRTPLLSSDLLLNDLQNVWVVILY